MKNAADYLAHLKALIVVNPQIVHWTIVREESVDDIGLLRYRIGLQDGAFAEMFERFQIVAGQVNVSKYSFHWQRSDGQLMKRWDNAAHHPEVQTSPHHLHDGSEDNVQSSLPMSAEQFLQAITTELVGELAEEE